MAAALKPWAWGPFELLLHAELHYRVGEDFDRRIAIVGFDNAIEVAVTAYLNLHPLQRGKREYKKDDVAKWLSNYHSKLEFFFKECGDRGVVVKCKQDEVVWFHEVRNGQYHVGGGEIPHKGALDGVRAAAIEVFSVLFEEEDVDALLEREIASREPNPFPPKTHEHDRLIDAEYGMAEVCGEYRYTSEVLYGLDPERYREMALELSASPASTVDGEDA